MLNLKEKDFVYWGKAELPASATSTASTKVIQYIDPNSTQTTFYRTQVKETKDSTGKVIDSVLYVSKSAFGKAPSASMALSMGPHGGSFGYALEINGDDTDTHIYLMWNSHLVKFDLVDGKTIKASDLIGKTASDLGNVGAIGSRVSIDKGKGRKYFLFAKGLSGGNLRFNIVDRKLLKGTTSPDPVSVKIFKTIKGEDLGITSENQTYQSAAMAYPYVFVITGDTDPTVSSPQIYWTNILTDEKGKFTLKFGEGNIYDPTHPVLKNKHHEPETINVVYALDDEAKETPIVMIELVNHDPNASDPVAAKKVHRLYLAKLHDGDTSPSLYYGRETAAPLGRTYYARTSLGKYTDIAFKNKVGTYAAGTAHTISDVVFTDNGTPRLKNQDGYYISANMKYISLSQDTIW